MNAFVKTIATDCRPLAPRTTNTDGGISDPLRLVSPADRALTTGTQTPWLILLLGLQAPLAPAAPAAA